MHDVEAAKLYRRLLDKRDDISFQLCAEFYSIFTCLKVVEVRHVVRVTRVVRQLLDNARRKGFDDDDSFTGEVNAVERVLGVADVLFNRDGRVVPDLLCRMCTAGDKGASQLIELQSTI